MKNKFLLLTALLVTMFNLSTHAMIGGTPANRLSDDEQAQLAGAIRFEVTTTYSSKSFVGSGIHIGNGYILTAHHVGGDPQIRHLRATDMALKPSVMPTRWHLGNLNQWEVRTPPAKVHLQDQYGQFQLPDVALIRPSDPEAQKKFAQLPAIKIFTGAFKELAGAQFYVLGFGKGNTGPAPELGRVNLAPAPAEIQEKLKEKTNHLIFSVATSPVHATVQSGDSGGPLLAKLPSGELVIVGVASEAWSQSIGGFSPLSHSNVQSWLSSQLSEIGIRPFASTPKPGIGIGNPISSVPSIENPQPGVPSQGKTKVFDFDFTQGRTHFFQPIFSDVPLVIHHEYSRRLRNGEYLGPVAPLEKPIPEYPEEHSHWLMNSGIFPLPDGLPGKGFLMQGSNHSDDMDMRIARKFSRYEGLKANTTYQVRVTVDLAGDAPGGAMGVGGAPDLSLNAYVFSGWDPTQLEVVNNQVQLKDGWGSDLQAQASVGTNVVCFMSNSMSPLFPGLTPCPKKGRIPFQMIHGRPSKVMKVKTDSNGDFWLLIGSHSGFESFSAVYYTRVRVEISE